MKTSCDNKILFLALNKKQIRISNGNRFQKTTTLVHHSNFIQFGFKMEYLNFPYDLTMLCNNRFQ